MSEIQKALTSMRVTVQPIIAVFSMGLHEFRLETEINSLFVSTRLFMSALSRTKSLEQELRPETYIDIAKKPTALCNSVYEEMEAQHTLALEKTKKAQNSLFDSSVAPDSVLKGLTEKEVKVINAQALAQAEVLWNILHYGQLVIGHGWSESLLEGGNGEYKAVIRTTIGDLHIDIQTKFDADGKQRSYGMQFSNACIYSSFSNLHLLNVDEENMKELNKMTEHCCPSSLLDFIEKRMTIPA